MHTIETRAASRRGSRWKAPAAALVAATLLAGAVAPASATVIAPYQTLHGVEAPRTAFHHHFYRGVPGQNRHRGTTYPDMMAVAAEPGAQDEAAVAYCADRFKSYDPASGTYLGYDGYEHACP